MAKKYDIFISYRRVGGEDEAWKLKLSLEKRGYRVFMDREALRSGEFNTQLYNQIDACNDVLLICSKGSIERCMNEDDWVRLEIAHAIKAEKNIIPVWINGFSPDEFNTLPAELEVLPRLQAITPQNEFYEESISKLVSYLYSKPVVKYRNWVIYAMTAIAVSMLAVIGISAMVSSRQTGFPSGKAETKQVEEMQDLASCSLSNLNYNLLYLEKAISTLDDYVSGYNSDEAEIRLELEYYKKEISDSKTVFDGTVADNINYQYFQYMEKLVQLSEQSNNYTNYIDYLEDVVFLNTLGRDKKKAILDECQSIVSQDAELGAVYTFLLFLPVSNPNTTLKDLLDLSIEWKMLPAFGKSWISGVEQINELERRIEIATSTKQNNLLEMQSSSGVMLSDYEIEV